MKKKKSRQLKWQEKMLAEGKCTRCGETNANGKWTCDKCKSKYVRILASELDRIKNAG